MRPKQSFPRSRKPENSGTDDKARPVSYCCAESGHKAKNPSCPAFKVTCNACHKIGHFSHVCQSSKKKIAEVREVPCPDDSDKSMSDEHVSVVGPHKHDKNITTVISGVVIDMFDSGASVNVIDSSAFRKLAQTGVTLQKSNICLFTHGTTSPLAI